MSRSCVSKAISTCVFQFSTLMLKCKKESSTCLSCSLQTSLLFFKLLSKSLLSRSFPVLSKHLFIVHNVTRCSTSSLAVSQCFPCGQHQEMQRQPSHVLKHFPRDNAFQSTAKVQNCNTARFIRTGHAVFRPSSLDL